MKIKKTNGIAPEALIDIEPNRREGERYGYVENVLIDECQFLEGSTQGVTFYHLDETSYCIRGIVIRGSLFSKNQSTHLAVRRALNVIVDNCVFESSGDAGSGGQVALSGKQIKFCNNRVVKGEGGNFGVRVWSEGKGVDVEIVRNVFEQNNGSFLRFEEGDFDSVVVENNVFKGNVVNMVSYKTEGDYRNVEIRQNRVASVASTMFQLSPTSTFKDYVVEGNSFVTSRCPIDLRENMEGIYISGNRYVGHTSTPVTLNGAKSGVVSDNMFEKCSGTRVVSIVGEGDAVVMQNVFKNCNPENEVLSVNSSVSSLVLSGNVFESNNNTDKIPYRIAGATYRTVIGNTVTGYLQEPIVPVSAVQYSNTFNTKDLSIATSQKYGTVRSSASQSNSTATEVAQLVTDFNSLLAKMRTAGLLEE